jgi:hypothetical protein
MEWRRDSRCLPKHQCLTHQHAGKHEFDVSRASAWLFCFVIFRCLLQFCLLIMIGLTILSSSLLEVIRQMEKLSLMSFETVHQRENSSQSPECG